MMNNLADIVYFNDEQSLKSHDQILFTDDEQSLKSHDSIFKKLNIIF